MKIILEDSSNEEIEVTIKGNITDSKVQTIVALLKSKSLTSKLIAFDDSKEVLINIKDIYYFTVSDRKVIVKTEKKELFCKYSLAEILELFKSYGISQISKSYLVNINHIESLESEFSGNYTVRLKNKERLIASRFYMRQFRKDIMEG